MSGDRLLKLIPPPLVALLKAQKDIEDLNKMITFADTAVKKIDSMLRMPAPQASNEHELKISSKSECIRTLEKFIDGKAGKEAINAVYEYVMKHENCQFCRSMIASAKAESDFGNMEKARYIALEVYKYMKSAEEG